MSSISQPGDPGTFIEVAGADLVFRRISVFDETPTGSQILGYCDLSPREDYAVLQWLAQGDIEELRPDETVDLRGGPARFIIEKTDRLFRFVLNDRSLAWPRKAISVAALRTLGGIEDADRLYVKREDEPDERLEDGGTLALGEAGVENVYTKREAWKLNVQGVVISSPAPTIVVRQALLDAGFNPEQGWIIILKTVDAKRQVTLDETIDLRAPGIEKLRLTPREINNGETAGAIAPRRDFALLATDAAGLEARGLRWESVADGGRRWLFLPDFPVPPGYTADQVVIALDIPPSYPQAEIDMFYCLPRLDRAGGGTIPQADVFMAISGRTFQRWSRHRGPGAPWRPGIDSVLTHLALVEAALLREVER